MNNLIPKAVTNVMLTSIVCSSSCLAADFTSGPVFTEYGKKTTVEGVSFDKSVHFKVAFDVAKGAEAGNVNRQFDSLARFINMHVASGVPANNIQLALVVHGSATLDLLKATPYQQKYSTDNQNIGLIEALLKQQVRVIVCGQSAAAHGYENDAFITGVEVALSAMSAHALLQQEGYTLNPF